MNLETNRLILKRYTEEDFYHYLQLKDEPLVWKYSSKSPTSNIDEVKQGLNDLIKSNSEYQFHAMFLKETGEYIGEAGILSFNSQNNRAVIGYNLLPQFWKLGYATEITSELVRVLFHLLKVERVEALVVEDNLASRKVLEKIGFKLEGLLRHFTYINQKYCHVCYYGLIREDYIK